MSYPVKVSVIIPVYNREKYIKTSVNSILAQTIDDFEIIIIDDGSTDNTSTVISQINDPRIRLITHESNRGISAARNTGLIHVKGEYTAWLDSDDYAYPNRLEEQLRYLENNTDVSLIGCCAALRGPGDEQLKGIRIPPFNHEDILAWLMFRSAFQQSSVFGRSEILTRYPYREDLPVCEDYDVFIRIAREHRVCNLKKILIDRRLHSTQVYQMNQEGIYKENKKLVHRLLEDSGINICDDDISRHAVLGSMIKHPDYRPDRDFLSWTENWLLKLRSIGLNCSPASVDFATGYFWAKACIYGVPNISRIQTIRIFFSSTLGLSVFKGNYIRWLLTSLMILIRGIPLSKSD